MNTFTSNNLLVEQDQHGAARQAASQRELAPKDDGAVVKRMSVLFAFLVIVLGNGFANSSEGAEPEVSVAPSDPAPGQPEVITCQPARIWQGNVGDGFQSSAQTFAVETAVALGVQAFGGRQVHDFALLSFSYGHMLGDVVGEGHWYRGNWEARAELFSGGQFSPQADPVVGLTPHLRYDFATGSRWVPFADLGAGVTASGVGPPDQSGTFEFNLQANIGTHFFVRDNLALTCELGYLHFSCGGIHDPNLGVNTIKEWWA
jgi:lipid A 3-O-deacylase